MEISSCFQLLLDVAYFGALLLVFLILPLLLVFKLLYGRAKFCTSEAKLHGKTVIITGGNSGIGKATAFDLAQREAKIILASRNEEKAKEVIAELNEKTKNNDIRFMHLDLMDLDSVRQFVTKFLKEERRLDILINNSGVGEFAYNTIGRKSKQGFDLIFGINYLGPFLLTYLLLDILKKTENSRIVNVSSLRHLFRLTTLKFDKGPASDGVLYPDLAGYNTSKLANVMHVKALKNILKDTSCTSVTANAVHPGVVYTDIFQVPKEGTNLLIRYLFPIVTTIIRYCALNPYEGAQTTIYAAVDESLKSVTGGYFGDCARVKESSLSLDEKACQQLWDYSIKMCDLKN